MVTALDQPSDRVRGLEAGADDFLTKPVTDVALISRVRSLARLKMVTDELRMRAMTSKEIGIQSPEKDAVNDNGRNGRILVVDSISVTTPHHVRAFTESTSVEADPNEACFDAGEEARHYRYRWRENFDGLRLAQIRSSARSM